MHLNLQRGTVVERLTEETLRDWNHFQELLAVCECNKSPTLPKISVFILLYPLVLLTFCSYIFSVVFLQLKGT